MARSIVHVSLVVLSAVFLSLPGDVSAQRKRSRNHRRIRNLNSGADTVTGAFPPLSPEDVEDQERLLQKGEQKGGKGLFFGGFGGGKQHQQTGFTNNLFSGNQKQHKNKGFFNKKGGIFNNKLDKKGDFFGKKGGVFGNNGGLFNTKGHGIGSPLGFNSGPNAYKSGYNNAGYNDNNAGHNAYSYAHSAGYSRPGPSMAGLLTLLVASSVLYLSFVWGPS
jgi:hypothetical protein